MTPLPSQTPVAFETPRLAIRWQGRRANFLESLSVALRGPRAPRDFDPAKSFFRLQVAPGRAPGRGIAGSFLWHVLLLSVSIPLSQMAPPRPQVALPQIVITWYGPSTDVAPLVKPKPKKPKPAPKTKPQPKPRQVVVARAYNPKTTVIFNPPHATSTRQVLIEPNAPPELPKSLPPLPNVISWAAEVPVQPEMSAQIFARRRKSSAQAMLKAPEVAGATPPAGPVDIAPSPDATPKPPLPIAPSAIHAVRTASSRATAAPAPALANQAPGAGPLRLATGSNVALQPPLPPQPSAIRARRKANAAASAAAPKLSIVGRLLVALSLSPGNAPPPPGNASAPISIGPHVAPKTSAAAPDLSANAKSGAGAPGMPAASAAAHGPEGLLILHDGNAPAPPAPPPPKPASALPKIAPVHPMSVRSAIPPRPAREAPAGRMVRHDLAHRVLGPWRIHTLLMNMPNLTSSSGSWVLNFADPLPVRLRKDKNIVAPLPVHSVDPEYPPNLKEEGVQGKVVLFAVIGRDGSVTRIRVVKSLDPVLDHNAEAAFSEWKFEPALLDDHPIDLRVIVTVPFHYRETR